MFSIFENRIEILSPGSLLPGINIKNLKNCFKQLNTLLYLTLIPKKKSLIKNYKNCLEFDFKFKN